MITRFYRSMDHIRPGKVTIVSGLRRVGKTVLLTGYRDTLPDKPTIYTS